MLRPKDIIEELGISAPSLRLWSKRFSELLSPGAQSSQTQTGGMAQRRYNQDDLELFKRAKRFLDAGKTYEETLAALTYQEPVPEAIELSPTHEEPSTDLAVIEQIHPLITAFEEALRAKDQVIASKDETIEALHLAMSSKDNELQTLHSRVEELSQSLLTAQTPLQPQIASVPNQTRFRWDWLGKLLTGETQDVG